MSQTCRKNLIGKDEIASLGDFIVYLHKYIMQYLLSVSACGEGD